MGRKGKKENPATVVGPNYMQLLRGKFCDTDVAIVLCGEAHEDAIDVTRSGGVFTAHEGWIPTCVSNIADEQLDDAFEIQVIREKGPLAMSKAKEWALDYVGQDRFPHDADDRILLMWSSSSGDYSQRRNRGTASILLLKTLDEDANGNSNGKTTPTIVEELTEELIRTIDKKQKDTVNDQGSEKSKHADENIVHETAAMAAHTNEDASLFVWGDLDPEAYALSHLRLMEEAICEDQHDLLIEERKMKRRTEQNIFTFDEWFTQLQSQNESENNQIHLILEASVPPWDVELERNPTFTHMVPAADCIRRLAEDEDMHELDCHDPSSDGVGSYLDFCYRRFMALQLQGGIDDNGVPNSPLWLHCVDHRDLGCEASSSSTALRSLWHNILTPVEQEGLGRDQPTLPSWKVNPEDAQLESLRKQGVLKLQDDEDEDDEDEDDEDEDDEDEGFTFPSFEGFFGQSTDVLYYDLHVQLAYAPFLQKCVGSMSNWHDFVSLLFFGGTISDAVSRLHIETDEQKGFLHVRSPLQIKENEFYARDMSELDATFPFLPLTAYLKAKGSSPSRTWTSQLCHELVNHKDNDCRKWAEAARVWALAKIEHNAEDPKKSDAGGGEWFLAYLRATHRAIYDDIDISDCALLLEKANMPSLTQKVNKYKIGKIQIPSCPEAFDALMEEASGSISDRSETIAKIIMDIYMNVMMDFSTILKLGHVLSNAPEGKGIVVVCYMGSSHTRALENFLCMKMGFQLKAFLGKLDWDWGEAQKLYPPPNMWQLEELLAK